MTISFKSVAPRNRIIIAAAFSALTVSFLPTNAQAADFEISTRADVRLGSGKPVNDVLGFALVLRYALNRPGWYVGGAIDSSPEFDIEYPLTFLGLEGPDEDSVGSSSMIMAFAERRYGLGNRKLQPFWSVGVGINSIDVDPFVGVLDDGTDFDLRIDAGTETVVEGTAGVRYQFTPRWSAMASALVQHRVADWTVTEQISGASTTVDDYTVSGAYFAVGYSF